MKKFLTFVIAPYIVGFVLLTTAATIEVLVRNRRKHGNVTQ